MNEEVTIQKPNGTVFQAFALVSTKSLIVEDVGLAIEAGDMVRRTITNGSEVYYRVTASSERTSKYLPPDYLLSVDLLKTGYQDSP